MNDTPLSVARMQAEIFGRLSVEKRFQRLCEMTQFAIDHSKAAIRKNFPHLNEVDLKIKYIEIHYGNELAEAVRRHLKKNADY